MLLLHAAMSFSENVLDARHLQLKIDGNWQAHTEEHLEETSFEDLVEKKLRQFMQKLGRYDIEDLHGTILDRVERPLIKLVMERTGNNQLRAAKMLGINRNTLRAKLQRLELI
jgi:DNA-binding protein Fis